MNDLMIYGVIACLLGVTFLWGARIERKSGTGKGHGFNTGIGIVLLLGGIPLLAGGAGLQLVGLLC